MNSVPKKRNSIEFKVYGAYALFSDPITRIGGEKCTYQVPTYEAIKGIVESIYWKPTIIWYIDAIRVMNKIQTESKGIKTIKMSTQSASDLSFYTYLKDVEYQVLAHFEFNKNYPELKDDWNENKHHNIAKRSVTKGGRRDIFLGTRECQGYVEPCQFGEEDGFYDTYGTLHFGTMFHGFDYPNESGKNEFSKRLWHAEMHDGIIQFPPPMDCPETMRQFIRKMAKTPFTEGKNFSFIDSDNSLTELLNTEV